MARTNFTFIDLFAGIGGFHAAMTALGGKCVYAVEIDEAASKVYERNWGMNPLGDISVDANEDGTVVPDHDVLCAGFPCQPFSKSGAQRGMDETRGTLYWNILRIIEERRPAIVMLENVRNIAGPRHLHEWQLIIETLRDNGYRVADVPAIFSPHLLPPHLGGRPQVRERVFITATRVDDAESFSLDAEPAVTNRPVGGWDPLTWHLESDLPLDPDHKVVGCELSETERHWIDAWDEFVQFMWEEREGRRLPGFPIWADEWVHRNKLDIVRVSEMPKWKANYLVKNSEFYSDNKKVLDAWTKRWGVLTSTFPPSRRKFEWQAQDTPRLWDTVMHFRPSGIRAKAPTYLPALVAITQTSIIGPRERRLSTREASRLQGLPEWFDFGEQPASSTYRQLGNGVSVGAVWHVFREHVMRDEDILKRTNPRILRTVQQASDSPDGPLSIR
jgi:DNA (cytosine-5)-methyltransferase 1